MKEMLGIRTLGSVYFPLAFLVHVFCLLMLAGTGCFGSSIPMRPL